MSKYAEFAVLSGLVGNGTTRARAIGWANTVVSGGWRPPLAATDLASLALCK